MKFRDQFKKLNETESGDIAQVDSKLSGKPEKRTIPKSVLVSEESTTNTIVQLFKNNNIKIKLFNPTPFGLQVDLFKPQKLEDVKKLLISVNISSEVKVRGNSIFIVL